MRGRGGPLRASAVQVNYNLHLRYFLCLICSCFLFASLTPELFLVPDAGNHALELCKFSILPLLVPVLSSALLLCLITCKSKINIASYVHSVSYSVSFTIKGSILPTVSGRIHHNSFWSWENMFSPQK